MMRDEPWDATIPERFEPSTKYHDDCLEKARARLADVETLSIEEWDARSIEEYAAALASHEKYVAEQDAENERYRAMLIKVAEWETEADGIRDFMQQQLGISISKYEPDPPKQFSGEEWREECRKKALRDIAYHEKAIVEEVHRTELRNIWLAALRRSLPADTSPVASS
jgi:hypothetical protein